MAVAARFPAVHSLERRSAQRVSNHDDTWTRLVSMCIITFIVACINTGQMHVHLGEHTNEHPTVRLHRVICNTD